MHDSAFAPATSVGPTPQDEYVLVVPPADVVRGVNPSRLPPYLTDMHEQMQATMARRDQAQRNNSGLPHVGERAITKAKCQRNLGRHHSTARDA